MTACDNRALISRLLKNELINLVYRRQIVHLAVAFVVLVVVDICVALHTCLTQLHLIAVELLDLCSGTYIEIRPFESRRDHFLSLVAVAVQVTSIHPIEQIIDPHEIDTKRQIYGRQYWSISFGEENLLLFLCFVLSMSIVVLFSVLYFLIIVVGN